MLKVTLSAADLSGIRSLLVELAEAYPSAEDPAFLEEATAFAQELPRSLRSALNQFRLTEREAVCVIAGYPADDGRIGPTPSHWKHGRDNPATLPEELYFFLCACLLGDPIGWATQQDGRLMHDVLPIKGHEHEQLGSGSEELITWHTEDAFHPLRTDYVGLMCLRNPDQVMTTFAAAADLAITSQTAQVLRQQRFPIRADRSHRPEHRTGDCEDAATRQLLEQSYEWIMSLERQPELISVLGGHPDQPYLRLDPYFMEVPKDDPEAADALAEIGHEIDAAITGYALRPGEVLFVDNYRAVHGRQPFSARFDGSDRWLKRLNVARDLRKSRDRRPRPDARIIY